MAASETAITTKQSRAIIALLSESTIAQAAEAAGVSERTMFRWLQESDFQEAYRQARRETVSQALAGIQQALSQAADTLLKRARGYDFVEEEFKRLPVGGVIRVKKTRKHLHPDVSAAIAIFDIALKSVELEDFEARLSALEDRTK